MGEGKKGMGKTMRKRARMGMEKEQWARVVEGGGVGKGRQGVGEGKARSG